MNSAPRFFADKIPLREGDGPSCIGKLLYLAFSFSESGNAGEFLAFEELE
jgi:hypothetical protein